MHLDNAAVVSRFLKLFVGTSLILIGFRAMVPVVSRAGAQVVQHLSTYMVEYHTYKSKHPCQRPNSDGYRIPTFVLLPGWLYCIFEPAYLFADCTSS